MEAVFSESIDKLMLYPVHSSISTSMKYDCTMFNVVNNAAEYARSTVTIFMNSNNTNKAPPSSTVRLKWKTDLEKSVVILNFDRRGWQRVGDRDRLFSFCLNTVM